MKEERFWMVWSPNGRAPTFKHKRRAHAEAEAKRLANGNPSQKFYVLKAVSGFVAASPKLSRIGLEKPSDEIPF